MKNILVIYYSQTGQLKTILEHLLSKTSDIAHIDYIDLKSPCYTFPLSWKSMFEMFPESVLQIPCDISYDIPMKKDYDLVILGFQTWFLHLSLPMFTFSRSSYFSSVIKDREVCLIMDCRNSWRQAMNYMEEQVVNNGGSVKGRYVFGSKGGNIIGSISILHWFFTGNQHLRFFPEPGVPSVEVKKSAKYGRELILSTIDKEVILFPLNENKFFPIEVEQYAIKKFRWWANYIVKKNNKHRKIRLFLFQVWLICTLVLISPVAAFLRKK